MSIKFTELPVLAGVDVADDDILAIVDVSAGVSKQVTRADLAKLQSGRNLIINGSGRINQRAYVSGAATSGANQYTLDRWRVVVSGQNISFTGTDAGRVMTAPAGGAEQVIEGANVVGGTYVLNWTGTATATVGGTARTKGETFTLTANTNVTIRFTGGTFSEVQLEAGSVATPFERRPVGTELALCQRYYQKSYDQSTAPGAITVTGVRSWFASGTSDFHPLTTPFKIAMRTTPSVVLFSDSTGATGKIRNASTGSDVNGLATNTAEQSFTGLVNNVSVTNAFLSYHFTADAEL